MRVSLLQEWQSHIRCVDMYEGQIQGGKHIYDLLEMLNACKCIGT